MSDVALSTMWAIGRFERLADFFQAGKQLGFTRFELNHAITPAMLAGLSLSGSIPSVHEPCPADPSVSELRARDWLIPSLDEEKRQEGVASVQRSIDLAQQLGATAVIVHPGRVDLDWTLESTLLSLYRAGQALQPEYARAKEQLVAARAAQAGANMRSVRRSLLELAEYAAARGVRLGLENRYHYPEIPLPDELEELLSLDGGETIGYWHDIGHGQVLQSLGLGTQEEWLRRFAGPRGRLIGVHLHDVVGISDHLAVGLGEVDWALVVAHLPQGVLRTCEFLPKNSPQDVMAGLKRVSAWLG